MGCVYNYGHVLRARSRGCPGHGDANYNNALDTDHDADVTHDECGVTDSQHHQLHHHHHHHHRHHYYHHAHPC